MLGAIIGDICGSVYEWNNEKDEKKVELFKEGCFPTDDSIMTVAVARALMDTEGKTDEEIKEAIITSMHYYGHQFPDAGYGGHFAAWLAHYNREAYNSWGNGSGMRVSSAGWLYDTLEETLHVAKLTAEVTHNHPEGIKGAQAIAAAVFLARNGKKKEEIREYIQDNFYDLSFTIAEIRPDYEYDISCQGACPQAIEAFLEGEDFEDVIRKAISVGGDSDTIAAMAGGIAEAYYGLSKRMRSEAYRILESVGEGRNRRNYQILAEEVNHLEIKAKPKDWALGVRMTDEGAVSDEELLQEIEWLKGSKAEQFIPEVKRNEGGVQRCVLELMKNHEKPDAGVANTIYQYAYEMD